MDGMRDGQRSFARGKPGNGGSICRFERGFAYVKMAVGQENVLWCVLWLRGVVGRGATHLIFKKF